MKSSSTQVSLSLSLSLSPSFYKKNCIQFTRAVGERDELPNASLVEMNQCTFLYFSILSCDF